MKLIILYCRTCNPMKAIAVGPSLTTAGNSHEEGDPPTVHTDLGALEVEDSLVEDLSYYDTIYSGYYV